ncbi:hypothetical protein N0V88_003616 [Collariella sp. IMI 366227]|nr:hypothetical protein N0V88_003616 [Collariella sp. IMI 366227]
MEVYDELFRWAREKDIEWHGIEPREIPGRGIGIVATKPLKVNERLIHVPTSALRTLESVRPKVKKALPKDTKVHAILAADLALDKSISKCAPWNAVVPSRTSLLTSPPRLGLRSAHLPPTPRANPPPKTTPQILPRLVRHLRLPLAPCMVLQPVADLFNHSADDGGCEVAFTPASFTISAAREYEEGEEVYICYGKHSNDFLLVEYGFCLERNRWDEVCVDEAVMPALREGERAILEERGFLGSYVLDEGTVCYRTQVAVRLLWEEVQRKVDELLAEMLSKYCEKIEGRIKKLESMEAGEACQREMLCMRWRQIRGLIEQTIERLDS